MEATLVSSFLEELMQRTTRRALDPTIYLVSSLVFFVHFAVCFYLFPF